MEQKGKILIVDSDIPERKELGEVLRRLSFDISRAANAEEAVRLVRTLRYDAILIDIAMPTINGIEACRQLREIRPHVGIVVVTSESSENTIIQALDAGADDYIVKPFHVGELAARFRSVIRRSRSSDDVKGRTIIIGEVELDPDKRIVMKAGKEVHLTPKEFDLLRYLMTNAGFPILHSKLLSAVWGVEHGEEVEYLRTFVRQLRKKLDDHVAEPRYLITIPHVGYRFRSNLELAEMEDRQMFMRSL